MNAARLAVRDRVTDGKRTGTVQQVTGGFVTVLPDGWQFTVSGPASHWRKAGA